MKNNREVPRLGRRRRRSALLAPDKTEGVTRLDAGFRYRQTLDELRREDALGFVHDPLREPEQAPKLHVPLGIDEEKVVALPEDPGNAPSSHAKEAQVVRLPTFRNRNLKVGTKAEGGQF